MAGAGIGAGVTTGSGWIVGVGHGMGLEGRGGFWGAGEGLCFSDVARMPKKSTRAMSPKNSNAGT